MSTQNPAYVHDDLLSRLTAAVDEAERVAKAATPGPWRAYRPSRVTWIESVSRDIDVVGPDDVACGSHCLGGTSRTTLTPEDAAHIAAWSPDVALRHVEHARRVMARHAHCAHKPDRAVCCYCETDTWPCYEVLDLAAAWGVTG